MHSMPAKPPPTTTKVRALGALGGVGHGGADLDPLQDLVAQGNGFLDGLQADALVRQALDGERAGDGAGGNHDVEVRQLEVLAAVGRGNHGGAVGVVDRDDAALDELGLLEVLAVGDHCVAGLDVAAGNFRQEGLVGHVGQRIDEGDDATCVRDLLLQFEGYVEADVPAADDEHTRTILELWGGCHDSRVPYFVKIFTNSADPPDPRSSPRRFPGPPRPRRASGTRAAAGPRPPQ